MPKLKDSISTDENTFHSGDTDFSNSDYKNSRFVGRDVSEEVVSVRESPRLGFSILGLIFVVLILAVLIRRFNNSDDIPTFTSLLEFLSNIKTFEIPFLSFSPVSFGDWGIFNFLRDFIASISQIVNVGVFICNGLVVLIQYIIVFCQWLFVF